MGFNNTNQIHLRSIVRNRNGSSPGPHPPEHEQSYPDAPEYYSTDYRLSRFHISVFKLDGTRRD